MDRCRFLKDLSSYLDNELQETERRKIESHIQGCKQCSLELSRLTLVSGKLKSWHIPELGSDFDAKLRNEVVLKELERGEVKMKKKTLAILIPSGVLAGILVLVFGVQTYVKTGYQGRLRDSADKIGELKNAREAAKRYSGGDREPKQGFEKEAFRNKPATADSSEMHFYGKKQNEFYYPDKAMDNRQRIVSETAVAVSKVSLGQESYAGSPEGSVIVIQPVLPATGEGERIIRTATVTLEVEDGKDAYKKAFEICQGFGGYIANSNFYKDVEGREAGTITMRIPKEKFLLCLDKLAALGRVENTFSDSQDVSQRYANLKTQLDTTMIVYNKMIEALQKRQVTIPEAMRLESELTPIRQRIENLKNEVEYLNNSISFTTITLTFHEPKVSVKVLKETRRDIEQGVLSAKINAVKFLAKALPSAAVAAALLFLILAAAFLVKHLVSRLFKRE